MSHATMQDRDADVGRRDVGRRDADVGAEAAATARGQVDESPRLDQD